jgi:hypothetical protein
MRGVRLTTGRKPTIPGSQIYDSLFASNRCRSYWMSLWWLTYNRHGRLLGMVIVEAASLISACVGISDNALDKGVSLSRAMSLMVSMSDEFRPVVGMMLSRKEAEQLLKTIERAMAVDAVNGPLSSLSQISGMRSRRPCRLRSSARQPGGPHWAQGSVFMGFSPWWLASPPGASSAASGRTGRATPLRGRCRWSRWAAASAPARAPASRQCTRHRLWQSPRRGGRQDQPSRTVLIMCDDSAAGAFCRRRRVWAPPPQW